MVASEEDMKGAGKVADGAFKRKKEKDEPSFVHERAHRILVEVFVRCTTYFSNIGLIPCCINLPLDPEKDAEEIANLHKLQELVERNRHWLKLPGRNMPEKGEAKVMKENDSYIEKFRDRFVENLTDDNLEGFFIYFYPQNTAAIQPKNFEDDSGLNDDLTDHNNPLRWVTGALVEFIDDGDALLSFVFSPRTLSGASETELLLVTISYTYLVFVRSMPYELALHRRIPWGAKGLILDSSYYENLPAPLYDLSPDQTLPPPIGKINLSCRLTLDEQDLEICPRHLWDLINTHFMQTGNHLEPNEDHEYSEDEDEDTDAWGETKELEHTDQLDATRCLCHLSKNIKQFESLRLQRTEEEKMLWKLMEINPPERKHGLRFNDGDRIVVGRSGGDSEITASDKARNEISAKDVSGRNGKASASKVENDNHDIS